MTGNDHNVEPDAYTQQYQHTFGTTTCEAVTNTLQRNELCIRSAWHDLQHA